MRPNAQLKYREQFNKAIDNAIKECSRRTGVTDLETVYRHVKKSASILFKRIGLILMDEQIRIVIQKRLKRCTVSVKEAAEQVARHAAQAEFEFFQMEQFRGVPQRISYPTKTGAIEYVEYNRSREWQREASIEHLARGIEADIARKEAEVASNSWLRPLVARFGDIDPQDIVSRWLR